VGREAPGANGIDRRDLCLGSRRNAPLCTRLCPHSGAHASGLPERPSPEAAGAAGEQGQEPGDTARGGTTAVSQALPVLYLGAQLLGEEPAAKVGFAAVADAVHATGSQRAVLGLQLILLTQNTLPKWGSASPGPVVGMTTSTG